MASFDFDADEDFSCFVTEFPPPAGEREDDVGGVRESTRTTMSPSPAVPVVAPATSACFVCYFVLRGALFFSTHVCWCVAIALLSMKVVNLFWASSW